MKSNALPTSSSSARSGGDRSETTRDVCYFPGCRKDMNCNCEICLASISATLDLMPSTAQKSSLTKLSFSGLTPERTPISFSCRTPETRRDCTPGLRSTAKSRPPLEEKRRTAWCRKFYFARFLVGVVSMFLVVDPGYRWTVSEIWGPAGRLSPQTIQRIGEESGMLVDLHDRLGFVQRMLEEELIHGKVFNCTAPDSVWEFNQVGFLKASPFNLRFCWKFSVYFLLFRWLHPFTLYTIQVESGRSEYMGMAFADCWFACDWFFFPVFHSSIRESYRVVKRKAQFLDSKGEQFMDP
ncbi:hypothetical protein ACLOJK_033559 [Asimina triloba]